MTRQPANVTPAAAELLEPILWSMRAGCVVLFVAAAIVAGSGPDSIDGISMGRVLPEPLGFAYLALIAALTLIAQLRHTIHASCAVILLGAVVALNGTAAVWVHHERAFMAAGVYIAYGVMLVAVGSLVRRLSTCPA